MATGNDDHDAFDKDSYIPEGTQFFGRGLESEARAGAFIGVLLTLYGIARYFGGW